MKIRKATKKDVETIVDIYSEGLLIENKLQNPNLEDKKLKNLISSYKKGLDKYFTAKLKEKNTDLFIAEDKSQSLAFCELEYKHKQAIKPGILGTIGEIAKIYVSPKHHKQGIATKLLKFSIKKLKEKCDVARCELYANNTPSLKLHEKMGFKPYAHKMELKLKKRS